MRNVERRDGREEEKPEYSKVKKLQRLEISFPPPRTNRRDERRNVKESRSE